MLTYGYIKEFIFKTLCFVLLFTILMQPDISTETLKTSALYAINVVAPALFPYMIMASMVSTGCFSQAMGCVFYPFTRYLLGIKSSKSGMVILVALIGGFAAAAIVLKRFLDDGQMNEKEAGKIMPAMLIPSAPFMILVVGGELYSSYLVGIFIAISTITAAFITAIVLPTNNSNVAAFNTLSVNNNSISDHITRAVRNATLNTVYICGFIAFFGMISGILQRLLPHDIALIISVILEFSTAVIITAGEGAYATTACLSSLGVCSFFQIAVILGKIACPKQFFISKIISSLLSVTILSVLFWAIPIEHVVFSSQNNLYILPYQYNIELSILVFLIIIISLTDFIEKKGLH